MQDDSTVFRVRFIPLIDKPSGDDESEFTDRLKSVGAMVIYGEYPDAVTIGATTQAADHIAELPFVRTVDVVVED